MLLSFRPLKRNHSEPASPTPQSKLYSPLWMQIYVSVEPAICGSEPYMSGNDKFRSNQQYYTFFPLLFRKMAHDEILRQC